MPRWVTGYRSISSSGRRGGSDVDLDNLVALCRACHDQTDAPFSKGRLVVRALGGGIFTFDLVHAVSKWDARRAIAGTEDEPKSTDFTAASAERSGDASAITKKRAGHIAAEPGVNRADDRAMANLRAAARRRPPPFPDVRLDDLSDWLRRRVDAHVIAMLKERDTRGLPLTDDQVYLIVLGHYGITCPHPRYEVPTMCDASQCAICGGYVTAWDRPR